MKWTVRNLRFQVFISILVIYHYAQLISYFLTVIDRDFLPLFTGFVRNLQGDFRGGAGNINTGPLKILKIRLYRVVTRMFIVMYIGEGVANVLRKGSI
jgi:hypothetical protein